MSAVLSTLHQTASSDFRELKLKDTDRILVLAPHPDDEVIGCAGVIQQAVAMKLPVQVVFLTYGDSNQWSFMLYRKYPVLMPRAAAKMGLVRHDEAVTAARILGLSRNQLTFLGYPDFGTLNIWHSRWAHQSPLRGILTRARVVPYKSALRPGASHKGEEIVDDLRTVIANFEPTKIFAPHTADQNGDHISYYLYMRVALWELRMSSVEIFPYLVHFLRWPKPQGFHPGMMLNPPLLLKEQISWWEFRLNADQYLVKRQALEAHKSQYRTNPKYLLSFVKSNELFGDFPAIRLRDDGGPAKLQPEHERGKAGGPPDGLNREERRAFVGVDWKSIRLDRGELVVSINLSRPLVGNVGASLFAFGYRHDRPFGHMPKVHVRLSGARYLVYDQKRRLPKDHVTVTRRATQVDVRIPLKFLDNPENILINARTHWGRVHLDTISWRMVEVFTSHY